MSQKHFYVIRGPVSFVSSDANRTYCIYDLTLVYDFTALALIFMHLSTSILACICTISRCNVTPLLTCIICSGDPRSTPSENVSAVTSMSRFASFW